MILWCIVTLTSGLLKDVLTSFKQGHWDAGEPLRAIVLFFFQFRRNSSLILVLIILQLTIENIISQEVLFHLQNEQIPKC